MWREENLAGGSEASECTVAVVGAAWGRSPGSGADQQGAIDLPSPLRVAMLPASSADNPYHNLLAEALADVHVEVCEVSPRPDRIARKSDFHIAHTHWLEGLMVRPSSGVERRLRLTASAQAFEASLVQLRRHGIPHVHTLHNRRPHDNDVPRSQLRLLRHAVRRADVVIVHSALAESVARHSFGRAGPVMTSPHGSYLHAYGSSGAPGDRQRVRERLGIPQDARVGLLFGEIRPDRMLPQLLQAAEVAVPEVSWIVAGRERDQRIGAELRRIAERRSAVAFAPGSVESSEIPRLFAASDVSVIARTDMLSSGSAILSLSMGVPIVVPATSCAAELGGPPAVMAYSTDPFQALRQLWRWSAQQRRDAAIDLAQEQRWSEAAIAHRQAYEKAWSTHRVPSVGRLHRSASES